MSSIINYLNKTRNNPEIYTKNNCPDILINMFHCFEEILELSNFENMKDLELILTNSISANCETQLIEIDKHYLVLELSELTAMSNVLEYISFGFIDYDSNPAIFHRIFEESHKFFEIKVSKDSAKVIRLKEKFDFKKSDKDLFEKSYILRNIHKLSGFGESFKIFITLFISHELTHSIRLNISDGDSFENFILSLDADSKRNIEFDYLDEKVKLLYNKNLSKYQLEELYCDYLALLFTWKVCIMKTPMNPVLFGLLTTVFYNSLYLFAAKKNITNVNFYNDICLRKIIGLRQCTLLYDKYIATLMKYSNDVSIRVSELFGKYEVIIEFTNFLCLKNITILSQSFLSTNVDTVKLIDREDYLSWKSEELNGYSIKDIPIEILNKFIYANSNNLKIIEKNNPLFNDDINALNNIKNFNDTDFENLFDDTMAKFSNKEKFINEFNQYFGG